MRSLTGQRFGRLTVIEKTDKRAKNRAIIWKCKCDCGKVIEARTDHLLRKTRPIKSCGCFRKDALGKATQ